MQIPELNYNHAPERNRVTYSPFSEAHNSQAWHSDWQQNRKLQGPPRVIYNQRVKKERTEIRWKQQVPSILSGSCQEAGIWCGKKKHLLLRVLNGSKIGSLIQLVKTHVLWGKERPVKHPNNDQLEYTAINLLFSVVAWEGDLSLALFPLPAILEADR